MKKRLDQILFETKQVESRSKAQALIMMGNILVNDQVITKAGTMISPDAKITIKETLQYVSRGGIKLEGALEHFQLDVGDQVILDVGASTGGFTDCLLQRGAKHVYCIDVGKNQLHEKLKDHPQVTWKEQFHVDQLTPQSFDQYFSWVVMDVSFISIMKVIKYLVSCVTEDAKMLVLFKPQFEADRKFLKGGVVKSETVRKTLIQDAIKELYRVYDFTSIQTFDSTIKGPKGNQEVFLYIQT